MIGRVESSPRHAIYLSLSAQVEGQLREAYERRYAEGGENQTSLALKLGVSRSVINKRLNGHINMTLETVADMVWALGHQIRVSIYDPSACPTCGRTIEREKA